MHSNAKRRPDTFSQRFNNTDPSMNVPSQFHNTHDGIMASLEDILPVEWDLKKLVQFPKNFFYKNKELYALSEEEVDNFRKKQQIIMSDPSSPRPCMTFQQAGFPR